MSNNELSIIGVENSALFNKTLKLDRLAVIPTKSDLATHTTEIQKAMWRGRNAILEMAYHFGEVFKNSDKWLKGTNYETWAKNTFGVKKTTAYAYKDIAIRFLSAVYDENGKTKRIHCKVSDRATITQLAFLSRNYEKLKAKGFDFDNVPDDVLDLIARGCSQKVFEDSITNTYSLTDKSAQDAQKSAQGAQESAQGAQGAQESAQDAQESEKVLFHRDYASFKFKLLLDTNNVDIERIIETISKTSVDDVMDINNRFHAICDDLLDLMVMVKGKLDEQDAQDAQESAQDTQESAQDAQTEKHKKSGKGKGKKK